MIDWHCHILPGMDDGSRSVSESLSLLNMQADQGIATVIATPHFYANDEGVESFIERREKAFQTLKESLGDSAPRIILGAEVRYYRGISRLPALKDLRIEGSKNLLLEMPEIKWSEDMIRELIEMASMSKVRIVLAHIDRYYKLQSPKTWKRLYESGIKMQVNASFFNSIYTKRKALRLLKNGRVHFVGSDCHNVTTRMPKIGKAYFMIRRRFGEGFLKQMNEYGYSKLV